MHALVPSIHLCDIHFTSRCAYQDAFVLPEDVLPHVDLNDLSNSFATTPSTRAAALPRSVLLSNWLLHARIGVAAPLTLGRMVLGWSCGGCGRVEVNRLLWETRPPPLSEEAAAAASSKKPSSKLAKRRQKKEELHRRALQVRVQCTDCWSCPRCSYQGDADLLHHQPHSGVQVDITPAMRYHVKCPYCRWQGCVDFESLQEVNSYMGSMTVLQTPVLRLWRSAQREANEVLRRGYEFLGLGRSYSPKPLSFSKMAWDKYVELRRPAHRQLTPTSQAIVQVRESPEPNDTTPTQDAVLKEREDEASVFREVAHMNNGYSPTENASNPPSPSMPLHPAVALDKLRTLYYNRSMRCMARLDSPHNAAGGDTIDSPKRTFPSYVVEIKCRDLFNKRDSEEQARDNIQDQVAALSDEVCWLAAAQRAHWGFHPSYIATPQDVEELQKSFSAYTAPFAGHISSNATDVAPLRGVTNCFPGSAASPLPTTANLPRAAQVGGEAAAKDHSHLSGLLQRPENRRLCEGLINYFSKPLLKEGIVATVLYSVQGGIDEHPKAIEGANTSIEGEEKERELGNDANGEAQDGTTSRTAANGSALTRTAIILDRSEQEEDVRQILEYWRSHPRNSMSDSSPSKLGLAYNLVCANHFNAVRTLPYLQYVSPLCLSVVNGSGTDSPAVESQGRHRAIMTFRYINLGTQEMVIRRIRVARQFCDSSGGGVSAAPSIELSSKYQQIFHSPIAKPEAAGNGTSEEAASPSAGETEGWVRLLPRCSPAEAAASNFENYATAELPAHVAENCVGTTTELCFDIILSDFDTGGELSAAALGIQGRLGGLRYLGLLVDAFTFLDMRTSSSDKNATPFGTTDGYYAISFGNTIVW